MTAFCFSPNWWKSGYVQQTTRKGSPCAQTPPSSPWHGGPEVVRSGPLQPHHRPRPHQKASMLPLKSNKRAKWNYRGKANLLWKPTGITTLPLDGRLCTLAVGPLPPLRADPAPSVPHLGQGCPQRSGSLHHLQTRFGLTYGDRLMIRSQPLFSASKCTGASISHWPKTLTKAQEIYLKFLITSTSITAETKVMSRKCN